MKKYKSFIIAFILLLAFCITICFIPIDATKFIPAIEKQVADDLGANIHIERLILRFGPSLKVKTPVMHVMYQDGRKFAQLDGVKIFIPWSSLFRDDIVLKKLYANKCIINTSSDDKEFYKIINKLSAKNINDIPITSIKNYDISYTDTKKDKIYSLNGHNLEISKVFKYETLKIISQGEFLIDDKKFLSYDISLLPNINLPDKMPVIDALSLIEQIEALDFHSDIIADLKLYNNINGDLQMSGLVNIDNISVLDKEKKTPKSFIYLTFLGDKIGIFSNIYASVDKKVYIEGVATNSKKKNLDLKVRTDEINLDVLYQKLKLFSDLSRYKIINSVTGTFKADFSIKGDINKIKSSGYLKLTNASITANGLDIKNINSDIDFSNNIITITNAIGYVNNAPIMLRGKIDKNLDLEILMNKVELKHLCPVSLGIKSGIISLVADISGTLDNINHKENLQIENFKYITDKNTLTFNTLKLDTNKNNVAYINSIALKSDYFDLIKIPSLKLNIAKDIIKLPDTNVFMKNSKLTAKGEFLNYNTKDITFNIGLAGNVNSRDVKFLDGHHAIYPIKISVSGNSNIQDIAAQILMEKALILDEPSIINFISKLENKNLKIDDLSVSPFSGTLSNDFKSNIKGQKKLIITGNIDNIQQPIFKNLRIFIPQQLNLTWHDTIAQLKGDIFINGNSSRPDIVGQISIQNLINQFLQLSLNNCTVDFNKSVAILNIPQIKIADSALSVNSTVSTDLSKSLNIKNIIIKSKYINADTFLMYKDNPIFKSLPFNIESGKFYAEKAIATLYNAPVHLSALTSDLKAKNNVITINNLYSEMYNGKLAGVTSFNLKDETYTAQLQGRGVSAAPIFDIISTRKDSISGTMDFDTDVTGNLSSKSSLNGDVKFIVHNGRMGTLGKLEHLLYAQNVVADNMLRTSLGVVTKAITLKDTGLFKYLRGDVTLNNGIANVKMLQTQGPLMALFIKGTYNPETDNAKFVVLGRLSDEIVSGLGSFGDFSFNKLMVMLTGEDKKYNILPEDFDKLPQLTGKNTKEFRSIINGTLDKPSSVLLFNWISYSQKSYRQKDVPMTNVKIPDFVESLPY